MGITPRSVKKEVKELIDGVISAQDDKSKVRGLVEAAEVEAMSEKDLAKRIKLLEKQMLDHAKNLEFEKAALLRDQIRELKSRAGGGALKAPAAHVAMESKRGRGGYGRGGSGGRGRKR
jgi:excinuclease ABC subunit B